MRYCFASLNSFPQGDVDDAFSGMVTLKIPHKYKSQKVQSILNDNRSQI